MNGQIPVHVFLVARETYVLTPELVNSVLGRFFASLEERGLKEDGGSNPVKPRSGFRSDLGRWIPCIRCVHNASIILTGMVQTTGPQCKSTPPSDPCKMAIVDSFL